MTFCLVMFFISFKERTIRNIPAKLKLKKSGIALLFAISFINLSGYHHVPQRSVDKIIAKFGFRFFSTILCCTIKALFGKLLL